MPGGHQSCRAVDIEANIVPCSNLRLPCVQAHAGAEGDPLGPGMRGDSLLGCHGCSYSIHCARKDDEEAVALGADLLPMERLKDGAQEGAIVIKQVAIALALLLQEAGGAL